MKEFHKFECMLFNEQRFPKEDFAFWKLITQIRFMTESLEIAGSIDSLKNLMYTKKRLPTMMDLTSVTRSTRTLSEIV